MENLYWMRSTGKVINLVESPFESEQKLEKYIFQNQELLEDIYIFKRQVRAGTGHDIPDMLGIDLEGNICIIELKNDLVTEDVLSQVLRYAIWAETNPDSVKAMWLESEDRPEEIQVEWDSADVRIIVVGPRFRSNVQQMTDRIGYDIGLLRITRFAHEEENEVFIMAEQLEHKEEKPVQVSSGQEEWDREFYEKEHGKKATSEMYDMAEQLMELVKRNGWSITMKPTKYYIAFKYGNVNPFNLHWGGTHAWKIHVRVSREDAENVQLKNWELQRYDEGWNQAVFRRANENAKASDIEELLNTAYERTRGQP